MASLTNYSDERDASPFAVWIVPALIISILLHVLLAWWARGHVISEMSNEYLDQIVPRTFRIERAEIDPRLLEPEPSDVTAPALAPVPVRVMEEKVSFDTLMGEPDQKFTAPKIDQPRLSDKPNPSSTDLASTIEDARASGAESLLDDPRALRESLLKDLPVAGPVTLQDSLSPDALPGSALVPEGALRGSTQPGFSNLDDLLAQTGPLSAETAPILMPTDLLFDYDASDLRDVALESLSKLAALIQKNPQSSFLIEGHTDSFGSEEYNLELSTRRADSVKSWLVAAMAIPAERVQTRGFGEFRLIAPSSGSIEDQQINRRVEIVIRPNTNN